MKFYTQCLNDCYIMLCKWHWIVLYTVHFTAWCLGGPFLSGHGVVTLAVYLLSFSRYWRLKLENRWNFTPYPSLRPNSGGTPLDIDVICTPLKSAFNGLQFRRWHFRSIFGRLAVVASQSPKSREIPTKFYLTAVQGHPRSSMLVSIESPCTTSY